MMGTLPKWVRFEVHKIHFITQRPHSLLFTSSHIVFKLLIMTLGNQVAKTKCGQLIRSCIYLFYNFSFYLLSLFSAYSLLNFVLALYKKKAKKKTLKSNHPIFTIKVLSSITVVKIGWNKSVYTRLKKRAKIIWHKEFTWCWGPFVEAQADRKKAQ